MSGDLLIAAKLPGRRGPSTPRWLVQRACEIDGGALCDTALENATGWRRAPGLEKLGALRRAR